MTDFIRNYEPDRFDVVYGLARPRDSYLDAYVEQWLRTNYRDRLGGAIFGIGSSLFSVGDFIDLPAFVAKLRTQQDPISKYVWDQFSGSTQGVLTSATPEKQKLALVQALDNILKGVLIYETVRFAGVALSPETLALMSQNPKGRDLICLNRLLLEDAYPLEIEKSRKSTPAGRMQTQRDIVTGWTEKNKINFYNKPITEGSFDDLNNSEFTNKLKRLTNGGDYLSSLERTRAAVAKIGAASYQSLSKGDSKLTENGFSQLTKQELGDLRFFLAVGRACKYGIDYVLTRTAVQFKTATGVAMSEEPKLHYVLDEISSSSIAGKQKFPLSAFDDKKRPGTPITTSELRVPVPNLAHV